MVQPVVDLLIGRGYRVIRVADIGLADAEDWVVIQYADGAEPPMVVVTFDRDFLAAAVRRDARCLWFEDPEWTARDRLADSFDETIALLMRGQRLVRLRRDGPPE